MIELYNENTQYQKPRDWSRLKCQINYETKEAYHFNRKMKTLSNQDIYFRDFTVKIGQKISRLASLKDGWGDYEKNKAFSDVLLEKIREFLLFICSSILNKSKEIEFPEISPVDTSSIDIHWKNDKFQLLINIIETEDYRNIGLFGRRRGQDDEMDWHGNIDDLGNVILGWLLTVI